MAKTFIIFISSLFFIHTCSGQKLYYDLEKDKLWLDSMKRIVSKGWEDEKLPDRVYIRQYKYFNACVLIGEYYERLYRHKTLSSKTLAVKYYEKVTDYPRFPDDPTYYKAGALRNNVCRKLAAIYFSGDGVKKNWNKSLELALDGSAAIDGFFEYYSMKYFHTTGFMLDPGIPTYLDSSFSIEINPFAAQAKVITKNTFNTYLKRIAEIYKYKSETNKSLAILISGYPVASMKSQSICNRFVENMKDYFIGRMGISAERIDNVCNVGGGDSRTIDIDFKSNFRGK